MQNNKTYCYDYPRPMVTADCLVFCRKGHDTYILLIQRKNPPFKNNWALPGGFVDMDETAFDGAKRELLEETGLNAIELQQFRTYSELNRDPRGRTISIVYVGFLENEFKNVKAGDDAANAEWFHINDLPDLAFDHYRIIQDAAKEYKIFGNNFLKNL